MNTLSIIAGTMIAMASLSAALAQPRRPASMAPGDILRVANVGDPQISPNGQWVVYTVSTVAGNETMSTLWLMRAGTAVADLVVTNSPRGSQRVITPAWSNATPSASPLLPAGWNASNPRWSPDNSKIAFLGTHEDQAGLWVVSLEKREPRFVAAVQNTNFFITYAAESVAWAPDSKRLAYISATEETSDSASSEDPRVIDRIQYKSRTSFSDNRRTHVWITAIDRPEPRQLTSGNFYDHAITFSPNGDEIAFLSNHEPDPDANNNSDIFAVDLHGETRQITSTKGCEYDPAWSPDGTWIAYTATKRDVTTIDSVAEDTHVWVTAASGRERRELTAEQDRRARSPRWSPDGRTVLFLANDRGSTLLYSVGISNNRVDEVLQPAGMPTHSADQRPSIIPYPYQVGSFSSSSSRSAPAVALTVSGSVQPSEVWVTALAPILPHRYIQARRVSAHNEWLSKSFSLVTPEEIYATSFDSMQIQGWLLKPAGWRADRRYPLILSIHGGPHGMYGWGFNPTFQVYAARGYAVLYLNPRGSSGYGQKFSDGTLSEWGGGDYRDLMAGVDEALRKYSWIDSERMGVTGGSYGGFMTNWIITQTPRFRAAVSSASVSNLISFYSTSLYQDLIHAEFGGFPWDNYELLWQWSPLRYVRQAQTPTMFIHGEQDNDVHITQAEEMYTTLKRRGVESILVRYPREGHGLGEPRHRVDALERTLGWFDRFLK